MAIIKINVFLQMSLTSLNKTIHKLIIKFSGHLFQKDLICSVHLATINIYYKLQHKKTLTDGKGA